VCGWESRDLRALLEARWTRLPEPEYERERELFGDLDELDRLSTEAVVPAADGRSDEVAALLERMREESPEEPFWRGVAEVRTTDGGVAVRFHEGLVPRDLPVGGARVQCHLYDDEALAAAEAARA
jgi:peptide/nickel transport system ATP-binding protein